MIRSVSASVIALAALLPQGAATPAFAQYHHHHHGGGGNWVAPFVGGALLGGALGAYGAYNAYPYYTQPYPYYAPPAYYPPTPRWCYDFYGRAYQC